jgi:leucyl-tRNA synthetase
MVQAGVEWLGEWACSRNFGLGTKIPNTEDIIDSLSDSTIYMAYYTIAHLITKIPVNIITNEMLDYVFLPNSSNSTFGEYDSILEQMKNEFNYWYPVDIRVSGKDLIQNHLTMALFNHQAIWKNEKYLPRSYYINGYLLLNGEKMSKHTGNFLTMRGAIDKYGVNATRFALASNDGIEDGDFCTKLAESAILKLCGEHEWIVHNIPKCMSGNEYTVSIWDKIFEYEIYQAVKQADNAYTNAKYNTVIKAFHSIVNAKDDYKRYQSKFQMYLMRKYTQAMITIMGPICPSWTEVVKNDYNTEVLHTKINSIINKNDIDENQYVEIEYGWNILNESDICSYGKKYKYYKDIIFDVTNECFSSIEKKKKTKKDGDFYFEVTIFNGFTDTELKIIQNMNTFDELLQTIDKKLIGQYKGFMAYIKKNINKYGSEWIQWVTGDNIEEFQMVSECVPKIFITNRVEFKLIDSNEQSMFKYGPDKPEINVA